jgi:hypothetical protein
MALNFKYVRQVSDYFRKIVDESDNTFMSNADAAQWLEIGYDEFRFFVSDIDPQQYHKVFTTPVITTNEYDLALPIVGPPAYDAILGPNAVDAGRMQQLLRVTTINTGTTPNVGVVLEPVYSYESLVSSGHTWRNKYILQGTKLLFSYTPAMAFRIEYIPVSSVDWTKQGSADTEWIDDNIQFHDIIALNAAKSYMMADGASSKQIESQLIQRNSQLREFLARGRSIPASRYVCDEDMYMS